MLEKNIYFIVYMSTQSILLYSNFLFILNFFLDISVIKKVCFTFRDEKCLITVNIFISPYNFISKMYDFLSFFPSLLG